MKNSERLIVALDVNTIQQAQVITHKLHGLVNFYKIGWRLFMAEGMNAVRTISNEGYNVFLDLKLNDIPNTIKDALHNMPCIHNVRFLTVMGDVATATAAREGLTAIKYGRLSACELKILHVTRLSSSSSLILPTSLVDIQHMVDNGVDGIITSGKLISHYRKYFLPEELTIVVPGVRLEGSTADDHQNLNTVESAFMQGADYIVVGRPIIEAENMVKAAEEHIKKIP